MALVLGVLMANPSSATAQGQLLGTVHGVVKDEQGGVLPAVRVTARAAENRPPLSTTTDSAGFYALKDLPPGEYSVEVELSGFAKLIQPSVFARAGRTLSLDFTLRLGDLAEAIIVRREAPLLEASSAATAINVSGDLQRAVPLSSRRDWADFLLLTPGVVSMEQSQSTLYSLHGAEAGSHVLQIDGADMASASRSINSFINLSTDTTADVQVKTGALDASAPLGLGAVVNLASTSGTNSFAGSAGLSFQPKRWNDNNAPAGTSTTVSLIQTDLSIGGPLIRDRWWFFGSYRHTHRAVGLSRTASQLAALRALVPGFRPFDNDTRGNYYFAKLTGQVSSKHHLNAFAQYDVSPSDSNGPTYAEKFERSEAGGFGYAIRLSSAWNSSLTSRLFLSYNDKAFPFLLVRNDRPARSIHPTTLLASGRLTGTGAVAVLDNDPFNGIDESTQKLTVSSDLTYLRRGGIGSHEFQSGFYLQPRLRIRSTFIWPNNGFALEDNVLVNSLDPSAGFVPFHRRIYDAERVPRLFTDSSDYAFYVQDSWRPTARLTVNAGLRLDFVTQTDTLFGVRTQDSIEIGPRVGVNYGLTSDGFNSLRASWTRVHEIPSQTAVGAGSTQNGFRDIYDLDLDGTFDTTFVTPSASAVNPNRVFDPDRWHQPFVDEWTLGYRRQLPTRVTVDLGWIQRAFRDRSAGIEINGIYDGGVFQGYRNTAINDVYLVTNNSWNWPVYSALELQVAKQTARVQLLASYSRQWRHLAGTWQPNDPAAFVQPDAFANARGIGSTRGSPGSAQDANSLSGSQGAGSVEWHDHTIRMAASYRAPWNVVLATSYVFQSGVWSGPVVTRLAAGDPRFGPATLQLYGRLLSNPLATPLRFVGETRNDGQFNLGDLHILNCRIGRQFSFGRRRIEASLDVINVTNNDADQALASGANQTFSVNYQVGRSRQLPRSAQASVRLVF